VKEVLLKVEQKSRKISIKKELVTSNRKRRDRQGRTIFCGDGGLDHLLKSTGGGGGGLREKGGGASSACLSFHKKRSFLESGGQEDLSKEGGGGRLFRKESGSIDQFRSEEFEKGGKGACLSDTSEEKRSPETFDKNVWGEDSPNTNDYWILLQIYYPDRTKGFTSPSQQKEGVLKRGGKGAREGEEEILK